MNEDFDYEELVRRTLRNVGAFFVGVLLCALVGALLGSCRTVRYVGVPEYHTVYKVRTDSVARVDSVRVTDSVWMAVRGDTVFKDRWRTEYRLRFVDRVRQDTLCQRDSVRVPVAVERELGWWERTKVDYFVPVCLLCGIFLVTLLWLIRRRV